MPRERTKLTDKQERILVQAQLMGLTPRDMQQVGNRLIALQKEAEDKQEIQNLIEGYSWQRNEKDSWTIITAEGYYIKFSKHKRNQSYSWERSYIYNISISKPGTAFKTRVLQKQTVTIHDSLRSKFCPENSKELCSMIKWASHHLHWALNQK
jgi:hypothetical protein